VRANSIGVILLLAGFGAEAWAGASRPKTFLAGLRTAVARGKFSLKGCPKLRAEQWMGLLLTSTPVSYEAKFAKGCDIEGTVALSRNPFPVDLATRGLPEVTRLKAVVTPTIDPELATQTLQVKLDAREGALFASEIRLAAFSLSVTGAVGLDGKEREPPSGRVAIAEFRGKPTRYEEKFIFRH